MISCLRSNPVQMIRPISSYKKIEKKYVKMRFFLRWGVAIVDTEGILGTLGTLHFTHYTHFTQCSFLDLRTLRP